MFPRGTERMAMRQSVLNGLNIKFHIIRLILDEFLLVTITDINYLNLPISGLPMVDPQRLQAKRKQPYETWWTRRGEQ